MRRICRLLRVLDETPGRELDDAIALSGSDEVYGITMSEDGSSLMLLTNRGLEQWQVLE